MKPYLVVDASAEHLGLEDLSSENFEKRAQFSVKRDNLNANMLINEDKCAIIVMILPKQYRLARFRDGKAWLIETENEDCDLANVTDRLRPLNANDTIEIGTVIGLSEWQTIM